MSLGGTTKHDNSNAVDRPFCGSTSHPLAFYWILRSSRGMTGSEPMDNVQNRWYVGEKLFLQEFNEATDALRKNAY